MDGALHLIGGNNGSKHLIWNDEQKKFKQIFDFDTIAMPSLQGCCSIYIASKNILLLFGGKYSENIYYMFINTH